MLFETFEVFFIELQRRHFGLLVFNQVELDGFPAFSDDLDLFLHLLFLFGRVSDIFHFVLELVKLQVPNGLNRQMLIDFEVFIDQLDHFAPVTAVRDDHRLVFEFLQKRHERGPLLNVFIDAQEGIGFTVQSFDFNELFAQGFDFVFHITRIDLHVFQ